MNKINLTGLKKCDQLWDEMMPNECGRLCQKCNKTIIDFRKLSDEEMTKIHLFKTEPICGIYRSDQLEYPVSNSRKLAFRFWQSPDDLSVLYLSIQRIGSSKFVTWMLYAHDILYSYLKNLQ